MPRVWQGSSQASGPRLLAERGGHPVQEVGATEGRPIDKEVGSLTGSVMRWRLWLDRAEASDEGEEEARWPWGWCPRGGSDQGKNAETRGARARGEVKGRRVSLVYTVAQSRDWVFYLPRRRWLRR